MKNKIKLIDVSMLSTYMGDSMTLVIAVFVIVVTVSALVGGGGSSERNIVNVCVPGDYQNADGLTRFEPFRILLGRETRRPVELAPCEGEWPTDQDLYIMPIHAYIAYGAALDIEPLYELMDSDRYRDEAVVITRVGNKALDLSQIHPNEVAFSHPSSPNRFLLQLDVLSRAGFEPPDDLSEFRFEGYSSNAARVVLGVIHGAYTVGACRLSDLTTLISSGVIRQGEVSVVGKAEAMPELIVASRKRDHKYYRRKLGNIGGRLAKPAGSPGMDDTVELLKTFGVRALRPVTASRLAACDALYGKYLATGDGLSLSD